MKKAIHILFLFLVLSSCKKKQSAIVVDIPVTPVVTENPDLKCGTLPPAPVPFGWVDTTVNENQNINTFMYNPLNPDEAIIVVNGDINGFNKMFCYNIRTQTSTYLASLDEFAPSINNRGWIVYSTNDNNVFKIKSNGDSLTQLTSGHTTRDAKWDFTGNFIYYFQMANFIIPAQLVLMDSKGFGKQSLPLNLPNSAPFKNSNKVIYQKTKNNTVTLAIHDFVTSRESELISGPYSPGSDTVYFDNLCLDNKDENFYWSNAAGIFRCSLSSLRVDTLFKNCATVKYLNPIFQKNRPNELMMGVHLIKQISYKELLHSYKALDYDFVTNEKNLIGFFP